MNLQYLKKCINNYKNSEEYQLMLKGDSYYKVQNDIKDRVVGRVNKQGYIQTDVTKANNKLSHGIYKNLVDEKISYILGKEYTLNGDKRIIDFIGQEENKEILLDLAYDITNHGKAWIHICYDEVGNLVLVPFPAYNVIPFWNMMDKNKLDMLIRFYTIELIDEQGDSKDITKIECWYPDRIEFYISTDKGDIIPDSEEYLKRGIKDDEPCGHFKIGGKGYSWGKIPFICFKNNKVELNDLAFIKDLIDNYDLTRSDVSNYLSECQNLIYVLKNYGGQDLREFMDDLNYFRAIKVDDDGGVDTLTPTLDITALKEHYDQLKRDILEFGQGVYKDIDNLGGSVSGIMIKMLYTSLELKTDVFGRYFSKGINQIAEFLGQAMNITDTKIDVVFNKDIAINETEVIDNILKSSSIVSRETLLANHPWVKEVEEEIKLLDQYKEENLFEHKEEIEVEEQEEGEE